MAALTCVVLLTGGDCDAPPPPLNDNGTTEATLQISPSGQAVALIDPQGFSNLVRLSRTEPTPALQPLVEDYIRLFAEHFGNDAEFVILMLDEHRDQLRFPAVGGFNITLRVPESGLGLFVSVPGFSSLPNLRSYIYLARKDSLVLGPSLHELAHGWGVRFMMPPALGSQASESKNHWGYVSAGGQMGGWMPGTLVDLGGGEFQLSRGNVESGGRSFNTVPYAPIEMYIMGLGAAEEVPPIEVALNPVFRSLFEFSAEGIVTITMQDIIEANGARIPSVDNSPKHFKLALLTVTDHELDAQEWEFYQDSIDYFSFAGQADIDQAFPESAYAGQPIRDLISQPDPEDSSRTFINFFEATQGRATVEFIVLQSPAEP